MGLGMLQLRVRQWLCLCLQFQGYAWCWPRVYGCTAVVLVVGLQERACCVLAAFACMLQCVFYDELSATSCCHLTRCMVKFSYHQVHITRSVHDASVGSGCTEARWLVLAWACKLFRSQKWG